ncbi:DUF6272 family protein [Aurantibacillus circumpalustris]|uniref:DUF6272 family protein n=1 Tax=Aurantibacillus circumpalustris TaxID=3036359 RepID=UPI00295BD80F|nr:DUF6272 family protein [Aurantibacillus circumpalustris]
MGTLIENLHNNNVIFSYYGFIDDKVLVEVLHITKSKLEGNNENPHIISRVNNAINECVDNVIKHNFYEDNEQVRYKSLLVVSKQQDDYTIDTINVVNSLQKESISEQLDFLKSQSKEELQVLKSKAFLGAEKNPQSGKGLIELALKADNCDCTFKTIDANYLFNINFKINTLN